jgi:hypothetical protein
MEDRISRLVKNKRLFEIHTKKIHKLFFYDYPNATKRSIDNFHQIMLNSEMGIQLYIAISGAISRTVRNSYTAVRSKTVENHVDIDPIISKWIYGSFEPMTKTPDSNDEYTKLINSIIYTYVQSDPNSAVIYGTFAYHLDNISIPYNDIDISTSNDFDLLMLIIYGFHMFVGVEVEVLAIPYIFNHRCIKVLSSGQKLADIHHIDPDVLMILPCKQIGSLYVLDDIFAFFNTFRALSVEERRTSISQNREKNINILSLLAFKCRSYYVDNNVTFECIIVNSNLIKLVSSTNIVVYFAHGVVDIHFEAYVKSMAAQVYKDKPYTLVGHKKMSNFFADSLVEAGLKNKSEYWINSSRNNLYKANNNSLKSMYIPVISDLTKLYFYGTAGIAYLLANDIKSVKIFYSAIYDSLKNNLDVNNISVYSTRVKNNHIHNHISIEPLSFNHLFPEEKNSPLSWKL